MSSDKNVKTNIDILREFEGFMQGTRKRKKQFADLQVSMFPNVEKRLGQKPGSVSSHMMNGELKHYISTLAIEEMFSSTSGEMKNVVDQYMASIDQSTYPKSVMGTYNAMRGSNIKVLRTIGVDSENNIMNAEVLEGGLPVAEIDVHGPIAEDNDIGYCYSARIICVEDIYLNTNVLLRMTEEEIELSSSDKSVSEFDLWVERVLEDECKDCEHCKENKATNHKITSELLQLISVSQDNDVLSAAVNSFKDILYKSPLEPTIVSIEIAAKDPRKAVRVAEWIRANEAEMKSNPEITNFSTDWIWEELEMEGLRNASIFTIGSPVKEKHSNSLVVTKGRYMDRSDPVCAEALNAALSDEYGFGNNPNQILDTHLWLHELLLNQRKIGYVFSEPDSGYLYIHIDKVQDYFCLLANARPMLADVSEITSEYPYCDMELEDSAYTFFKMVWKHVLGNWVAFIIGENVVTFNSDASINSEAGDRIIELHNNYVPYVAKAYSKLYKTSLDDANEIVGATEMCAVIDYALINYRDPDIVARDINTLLINVIPKVQARPGEKAKTYLDNDGFVVVEETDSLGFRCTRYFKRSDEGNYILEYTDRIGSTKYQTCEFLAKNNGLCLMAETDEEMLSVVRKERNKIKRMVRERHAVR